MNKLARLLNATIVLYMVIVLTGCSFSQAGVHAVAKEPDKRAAWLVYWDLKAGEKDLSLIGNRMESVAFFGAYFDKNDHLFIPPELNDKTTELFKKKLKFNTYLTFVNDKQNADGSVTMKDIEVLRRLLTEDATMNRHADEIITLAKKGKYNGIEIDYEQIWKDPKIGQAFLRFIDKLYMKAVENRLKLRVVLEPRTPFESVSFVQGPEYVVMLYNLYGLHSEPGPKANKEFIKKVVSRMGNLPGAKSVAFSTGGCVWDDTGRKTFITEAEAKAMAATYGAAAKRDEESQCLFFEYKFLGITYQVWYADVETLNYWTTVALQQGVSNISLWRLGGNLNINKIM